MTDMTSAALDYAKEALRQLAREDFTPAGRAAGTALAEVEAIERGDDKETDDGEEE